uniref:DUF1907 domain-containing protein n=1 Tax=Heterorhabditis bacteriophora TaxID=37862 RepID=A0A1I7XMR5_HETBA
MYWISYLSKAPFNMTSRGFGNGLRIAEIGGPSNLFPKLHKEKAFDLNEVCATCDAPHAAVFGPGAGPWPVVGVNCEMVADANLSQGKVNAIYLTFLILISHSVLSKVTFVHNLYIQTATKIAYIEENSSNKYQTKIIDSTKFSLMANLAVSENDDPSEVVHFKCSIRTGQLNLPETIRRAIAEHYTDKPVSLAGLFILHEGEAKLHVMPDFPSCPFNNTDEVIHI